MSTTYVCPRGHRTPVHAVKKPTTVISCPARVSRQATCGAPAREVPMA